MSKVAEQPLPLKADSSSVIQVENLAAYAGATLEEQVSNIIQTHGIVIFSKSFCPFCLDVKDFLTKTLGVQPVYALEVNQHPDGPAIHKYVKELTKHNTVPAVFIQGTFVGGCDDVKSLHAKDQLDDMLGELLVTNKKNTSLVCDEEAEGGTLAPPKVDRGSAMLPPFLFPNTVNNYIVRLVGGFVCILCIVSIIFRDDTWGQWLSAGLLVDFVMRVVFGSAPSPLGAIAAVLAAPFEPQFRPGPPKQFAAMVGTVFTLASTCCYFTGHVTAGAVVLGILSLFAFIEAVIGFCFGCEVFMLGIQFGIIPDSAYRIHTSTLQETKETWAYKFLNSGAAKPIEVDTDPTSRIALKYKKKTDEWTKDDFHLIRNMMPCFFTIPLGISGLATAFKIASSWSDPFRFNKTSNTIVIPATWYHVFSVIAAVLYVVLLVLFFARLLFYPKKIAHEWMCPWRSPSFAVISITMMTFAFLLYDEIDYDASEAAVGNEAVPQKIARVLLWMGTIAQALMTIAKMAEWVSTRLDQEHVQPQWIIFPVGLAVSALVGTVVPFFEPNELTPDANAMLARLCLAIAVYMWIIMSAVTFFTVVVGHNSDPRKRHGVMIWLAAVAIIGLADFSVCATEAQLGIGDMKECVRNFSNYYYIGLFIAMVFVWMTFPHLRFFGRDAFNKGYWMDVFSIDVLAACAAMFYALNNYNSSRTLMFICLTVASLGNLAASAHTVVALIHKRVFFTPMDKFGPMAFFKLGHEAFRGVITRMSRILESVDLDKPEGLQKLKRVAEMFNTFELLNEEHTRHEDVVVFKTFNDFFHGHADPYIEYHRQDKVRMEKVGSDLRKILNQCGSNADQRKEALVSLHKDMPIFFHDFLEHIRGEEDNLQPIGRKYVNLTLQKEMAKECFKMTSAERWEVLIPFIIVNMPRHEQRVRYLKALCWAMPERSQQVGAIVYRGVDAVMWERLRIEIPQMIPRGEENWHRFF